MFLPLWGMFLTVGLTSLDSDLGLFVKMGVIAKLRTPTCAGESPLGTAKRASEVIYK